MIYVGIDVAKDKHDCCILGPDTEELFQVFTIRNNSDGYGELFHKIESVSKDKSQIKIGLEATGHYSYNRGRKWLSNTGISGSLFPERWLRKLGQVAQSIPEYPVLSPFIIFLSFSNVFLHKYKTYHTPYMPI